MNINKEMRLHQWAQDMAEQKASGLSQKQWCKMKGIGSTSYEYRCRKVREVMEQKLVEKEAEKSAIISAANKAESLCEEIYIACGYTDLRYGIDGLAATVKEKFCLNPFSPNTIFLFCGRRSDRI